MNRAKIALFSLSLIALSGCGSDPKFALGDTVKSSLTGDVGMITYLHCPFDNKNGDGCMYDVRFKHNQSSIDSNGLMDKITVTPLALIEDMRSYESDLIKTTEAETIENN